MMYWEITGLRFEIRAKHMNALCGAERKSRISES